VGAVTVFAFPEAVEARIDVQIGRVDVVATSREGVQVTVAPSNARRSGDRAAAESVRAEKAGSAVVVKGAFKLNLFGPGDSVDIVVEVPDGSDLDVAVKYGSAHAAGRFGAVRADIAYGDLTIESAERVEVKGGHGDFRVTHATGDADVGIKSGVVRIARVDGALRLSGADGTVFVDSVGGAADITSSSGAIEVGHVSTGATIRSAYGNVRVRDLIRGVVRIDASYGSVDVGVRRGTAVWLDATSQHGIVRSDLVADAGPTEGEHTLELRVRTGYGAVAIHRFDAPPAV
jgi:hypothetical protein